MKGTYRELGRKNEHECAADGVKPSANGAYEQRKTLWNGRPRDQQWIHHRNVYNFITGWKLEDDREQIAISETHQDARIRDM